MDEKTNTIPSNPMDGLEVASSEQASSGQNMDIDVVDPRGQATSADEESGHTDSSGKAVSQTPSHSDATKKVDLNAKKSKALVKEKKRRKKAEKKAAGTWVPKNEWRRGKSPPGQTPKRQRSEASTPSSTQSKQPEKRLKGQASSYAEKLTSIRVAVVPQNFPEGRLGEDDSRELQEVLIVQMQPLSDGCLPAFNETPRLENGGLVLCCASPETKVWLEGTVANCNPWKGMRLEVVDAKKVLNNHKVLVRIPPPFDKMKVEEVLSRIQQHDTALSTKDWRVLSANMTGASGRMVVLALNETDFGKLRSRNLRVRLGLGQVQFQCCDRKPKGDSGEPNGSKGRPGKSSTQ